VSKADFLYLKAHRNNCCP